MNCGTRENVSAQAKRLGTTWEWGQIKWFIYAKDVREDPALTEYMQDKEHGHKYRKKLDVTGAYKKDAYKFADRSKTFTPSDFIRRPPTTKWNELLGLKGPREWVAKPMVSWEYYAEAEDGSVLSDSSTKLTVDSIYTHLHKFAVVV